MLSCFSGSVLFIYFFVSFVVGVKLNSRRCDSFCKESTFRRHKACCELTWIFIRILVKIVTQLQECTQDWHGGENQRILHVELWGTCVCVSTEWLCFPLRTVILDNLRKSGFMHKKMSLSAFKVPSTLETKATNWLVLVWRQKCLV